MTTASSFLLHDIWHPLSGNGYQFWSGIAGCFVSLGLLGGLIAFMRQRKCQAPRCWRFGPHRSADGLHRLCRKHHPDLPDRRLTLSEIHVRHHKAKQDRSQSSPE